MYSYFVWLIHNDGDFIRLNIATGLRPADINVWLDEFWKAVDLRLEQLKSPYRSKDFWRFRIALDPSHLDPLVWSTANPNHPHGAFKLAGEYPGRAQYRKFQA
jgi:hypothetical protein